MFVELTLASTNVTVWLNVAHIAGFYYDAQGEYTVVTVRGEREGEEVNVKETPTKLLTLIDRAARGMSELDSNCSWPQREQPLSRTY